MTQLPDILRADEQELSKLLAEKLQRSGYEPLVRAVEGDFGPALEAMRSFLEAGDRGPAGRWARGVCAAGGGELSFWHLLVGLSGLEKVIRARVIERLDSKRELLVALRQLTDAVDVLRRACAQEILGGEDERLPVPVSLLRLIDLASDPFCLATTHGRPFYLNAAARQVFGLEADEPIQDATLEPFHAPESWNQLCRDAVTEVNRQGCWAGRTQLRNRRTGQLVEADTKMYLLRDPLYQKPACVAIVHHLCSRQERKLDEALREALATRHAILDTSLDPIITINYEGKITEFNKAAEKVFGRQRQKVIGRSASEILFPEARIAGDDSRINRYLRKGEGSMLGQRREVIAQRANGETFPAELAMTLTREHGQPVMTFFVRDISERKAAEEAEARHREELERSNRELEQFAYVASHDLQEPLRKIRIYAERLEGELEKQAALGGREYTQRILDAAQRMQALVEGLLTLSRVTTEGQQFVQVDLKQVAEEVVADLEVRIEEVGGRVEVRKLPVIQADPLQMRQLFQNLIGNALKFRRQDVPPVVKVYGRMLSEASQLARGTPKEKQCRITVEDNGIGFEPKYLDRVFEVFRRLHPRDQYSGTGVGLAICKRIAERHGGAITATSTPGQGSKFTVILPVAHGKS